MNIEFPKPDSDDIIQLKKYAEDLANLYQSLTEKQKELERANKQLTQYAGDLNKTITTLKALHGELEEAHLDTIHRLALAAEYKDENTGAHIVRMARYCALMAEKLGLPEREVQLIFQAAPMHDIGKVGVPENILSKPGRLTEEEFGIMKTHTTIGAKVLANSRAEVLKTAQRIAISHHEQWNGRGYPQGLSGAKIHLVGRIAALTDTFDALTSRRPYKDPYPSEVAFDFIKRERGEHFEPELVDLFLANADKILAIRAEVNQGEEVSLADFRWSERDEADRNRGVSQELTV